MLRYRNENRRKHGQTAEPAWHSERVASAILWDEAGATFKPNSPVLQGKTAERIEILRQKAITERTTGKKRYLVQWTPGKTRYELSGITLQPGPESPPFDGFKAGERWFVFVSTPYETNKSFVLWSGVVEVR